MGGRVVNKCQPNLLTASHWGRTIRKVMTGGGGGGGIFHLQEFFFAQCLCRNFFLRLIPSARILLLLLFSRKKKLNEGFLKKVVLCGLGMITFNPWDNI